MSEMWVDKYQPRRSDDLVGNSDAIQEIKSWFDAFKNRDESIKRALLLTGPPGCGKTSAARIIANEYGYHVLEFNASDTRNKKSIEQLVKESSVSNNVSNLLTGGTSTPHLIVMDEVDGMSHGDRGGMNELISIINPAKRKSSNKQATNNRSKKQTSRVWAAPIICIANTDHLSKLKNLITQCQVIAFDTIQSTDIIKLIDKLCELESIMIPDDTKYLISEHAQGDCRRLLHFMQFICVERSVITQTDVKTAIEHFKRKKMDITISDSTLSLFQQAKVLATKDIIQYYYNDRSLIPLMIQENYTRLTFVNKRSAITCLRRCAELFSKTDAISQELFIYPSSELSIDFTGMLHVVFPMKYLTQLEYKSPNNVTYTLYLGNISSYSAQRKILKSIHHFNCHLKNRTKMLFLKHLMFTLLARDQLDKVVETLYYYELIPSVLLTLLRIKDIGDSKLKKQHKVWKKMYNAKYRQRLQKHFDEYQTVQFKKHGRIPIEDRYEMRTTFTMKWDRDKCYFIPEKN